MKIDTLFQSLADDLSTSARAVCMLLTLTLAVATTADADISGTVVDADSNAPIAGARVHLQGDPDSPVVLTGVDGSFSLPISPVGVVAISAAVEYDADAATNWATNIASAMDGDNDVEIQLLALPGDNLSYDPPTVANSCVLCHSEQVNQWQSSVHSGAATDFWVRDLYSGDGSPGGANGYVFLDTHDAGDTGLCATCHAPMADAFDPGNIFFNEVTDDAALEGVSCLGCHQIDSVDGDINGFHTVDNSTYRFPLPSAQSTDRYVWGPLDDVDQVAMSASYAPFFEEPRFCASCHQYAAPFGQTTWEEWVASPYSDPDGDDFRTCQTCHMPAAEEDGFLCTFGNPPLRPGSQRHSHEMIGATPETLSAAILLDTAVDEIAGGLRVTAAVTNEGAGHAFPTGVTIRNALLVIEATMNGQPLTQIAGPTVPFWGSDDVPGDQPGDYAGRPGKGFAKINEGRINGEGPVVRPVLFIDAEAVFSRTNIPSGATDVTVVDFALPADFVPGNLAEVSARLLYRRAFRALAVTKGWTETPQGGPIEIEVAADNLSLTVTGLAIDIPVLDRLGLQILFVTFVVAAILILRRRRLVL